MENNKNENEFFLDDVNVTEARYDVFLKKLELNRFRCFDKLEISFEERLTVIIAENGGGKTAILDALAGCLKNFLGEFYVEGYGLTEMSIKDVKVGTETGDCKLTADIEYLYNSIETERKGEDGDGNIIEEETLKTKGRIDSDLILSYSYGNYQSPFSEYIEENLIPFSVYEKKDMSEAGIGKKIIFPVLAYFGGETVKIDDAEKNENSKQLSNIYENALDGNRLHYSNFFNWWFHNYFEWLESIDGHLNFNESVNVVANNVNTGEYEKDSTFIRIGNNLKKINAALEYLLNDDPKKPTYKKLWVKKVHGKFVMGMYKTTYSDDGQTISSLPIEISQFSAGEKALFAYVADLGLRLLHANPIDTSADDDELYVFKGRGVVLIDEIDVHLHPKWQQKVIGKLLEIFPEIQFVVTTHSPLALSNVLSEQVRVIRNNSSFLIKELFPDFVNYGANVEKIISLLFNLTDYIPKEVDELFDKYFNAINEIDINDESSFNTAKSLEKQLELLTDPNHPKLIEGRVEIEFKELQKELNP